MHDGLVKIRVRVEFRELVLQQFNVCVVASRAARIGGALEEVGVAFNNLGACFAEGGMCRSYRWTQHRTGRAWLIHFVTKRSW